ncbi:MAG: type II secretion system F family protein, partial [Pelistega sp.]|nr:type II secretion system F family protein [Pelistega sp.]
EQLPMMLSMLASALKAGAGIQGALKTVVQEAQAPLSQEFGLVMREQRLGLSLDEALANLALRMPAEATYLVVSSLKISAQTGGNLAEALERVANTLRAVKQIEDKIEALTSQGKFQAKVMVCLPIVLMFALNIGDVQVLSMLWETSLGWAVLVTIIFLELCGIFFIRKIVRVDI